MVFYLYRLKEGWYFTCTGKWKDDILPVQVKGGRISLMLDGEKFTLMEK